MESSIANIDKPDGWGIRYAVSRVWMSIYVGGDVNIGSGNGLVPLAYKPLPAPMLNLIYVAIWPNYAPMSWV